MRGKESGQGILEYILLLLLAVLVILAVLSILSGGLRELWQRIQSMIAPR